MSWSLTKTSESQNEYTKNCHKTVFRQNTVSTLNITEEDGFISYSSHRLD